VKEQHCVPPDAEPAHDAPVSVPPTVVHVAASLPGKQDPPDASQTEPAPGSPASGNGSPPPFPPPCPGARGTQEGAGQLTLTGSASSESKTSQHCPLALQHAESKEPAEQPGGVDAACAHAPHVPSDAHVCWPQGPMSGTSKSPPVGTLHQRTVPATQSSAHESQGATLPQLPTLPPLSPPTAWAQHAPLCAQQFSS
jgi:hypothetical protein